MTKKIGFAAGFTLSYFVFTTLLYFILKFVNKLPNDWTYFHIVGITLSIIIIGIIIKKLFK